MSVIRSALLIYFCPHSKSVFVVIFLKGKVTELTPSAILFPSVFLKGCVIPFRIQEMARYGLKAPCIHRSTGVQQPLL